MDLLSMNQDLSLNRLHEILYDLLLVNFDFSFYKYDSKFLKVLQEDDLSGS